VIKRIKNIHKWLGIITGPFVFIIAITGCIYAFQEEIQNLTQPYRFYPKEGKRAFTPSAIKVIAKSRNPHKKIHAVMTFSDNHSSKVIFYEFDKYYETIYINPESGKILAHIDEEFGFFPFILDGHFYLWLPPWIGQPVVGSITLVFSFLVFSGLFLWWPRNGNSKQRLKIKWNGSWKRRNFDLHSVIGFYILTFSLIFIVTGLVWSFTWFRDSYYTSLSFGKKFESYYEPVSRNCSMDINHQVDRVFLKLAQHSKNFHYIEVHFPETKYGAIAANVNRIEGSYWKTDYYYFDQESLKDIPVKHYWSKFNQAEFADIMMRVNYDFHTGSILGLPGKILAFLVSLAIASLPITGILMYYGRKNKSAKRNVRNL
jgi:uncharacterized iron-regulated membrane protein